MSESKRLSIIAELNDPGDEEIHIHEVLFEDGARVQVGETLFIAEGSKSIFDIVSEATGQFHPTIGPGTKHAVGTEIGYIYWD